MSDILTKEERGTVDAVPREVYDETDKLEYYFTTMTYTDTIDAFATMWRRHYIQLIDELNKYREAWKTLDG